MGDTEDEFCINEINKDQKKKVIQKMSAKDTNDLSKHIIDWKMKRYEKKFNFSY